MIQTASLLRQLAAVTFAMSALGSQAAPTVSNGDFESGDLGDWHVYTTANGVSGEVQVVSFDTVGGVTSNALRLDVGQANYTLDIDEGAGIFQGFFAQTASQYVLSADIATLATPSSNADGGTFSLILDGTVVASQAFGGIMPSTTNRASLNYTGLLEAGTHELRVQVTRKFVTSEFTPYQFIDNVSVSTVPEPVSGAMMLLGLGALAGLCRWGGGKAA